MSHHEITQPDYGTAPKKLNIYIYGVVACAILTLIAFGAVMLQRFTNMQVLIIIFVTAIIQFLVQVICFLRLNTQNEQARMNVLSFVFTIVILVAVVGGSLWIMWSLNYYMIHGAKTFTANAIS